MRQRNFRFQTKHELAHDTMPTTNFWSTIWILNNFRRLLRYIILQGNVKIWCGFDRALSIICANKNSSVASSWHFISTYRRKDVVRYWNWILFLTFSSLLVTWCTNSLTFNNCTLCPHCIYVFCIYLRTNSDLCHLQHKLIGFYNREEKCLQRGTDWVFK
jgi:hypothetical protein